MMEEKTAREQIGRISGFRDFPKLKPAIEELKLALMAAESDSIGIRIIDEILSGATAGTICPYPADLRRAAWEENEKAQAKRESERKPVHRQTHCAICRDFGIAESLDAGNLNSVASWCNCGEGQRRAANPDEEITPERVNRARARLLSFRPRGNGIVPVDHRRSRQMRKVEEVYHGSF